MSEVPNTLIGLAPTTGAGVEDSAGAAASDVPKDLKRTTARGALVSTGAQAAMLILRTGSMVVLARLLDPKDFGLVGMVTAVIGFLGLFRDAGLSGATVQRHSITKAQTSTLFWINLAFGALLASLCVAIAPALASFYRDPRLFWVTVALASSFVFNGAAAQHRAMLQRSMRFAMLSIIDIVSLILSIVAGIGLALAGQGYWALVVMTICLSAGGFVGVWLAAGWIPGRPQRRSGIRSMLWYGGTVTLNSVIVYLAYNADKVLLGRFWGAEMLGIYGRAYQLINLPTESLNSSIGGVAFPALARVQSDPALLRSFFLKGYSLFVCLVMPITMSCALFAEDIVRVFLGPKWHEAVPLFRLMAPTILVFALINPFAWLNLAAGYAVRSLKIALLIAPVVILGYLIGIPHGPQGVAAGFSIAMILLVVPVVAWAKHGLTITSNDIIRALMPPCVSIVTGAAVILTVHGLLSLLEPTFLRLVLECAVLFGVYLSMLLFVMKQKPIYMELLRDVGIWPLGKRLTKGKT